MEDLPAPMLPVAGKFPRGPEWALQRLGRPEEAAAAYRAAMKLVSNQTERDFLTKRLDALTRRS